MAQGTGHPGEGRLADRAYSRIVEIINGDDLQIGDRLPSEPRLAEMFGMSRTVVREALVRLASDGITEARRGAGSYVKRRPSERLGVHMPLSDLARTLGTYEVRFVLEAEAARLAAQRRSADQLVAIEECLDALRAARAQSPQSAAAVQSASVAKRHRGPGVSLVGAPFASSGDLPEDLLARLGGAAQPRWRLAARPT